MIHSDNTGMVLPPKVAQTQVVIVPITYKNDDTKAVMDKAWEMANEMKAAGIRVAVDERDNHNPGFKFNSWEVKGVPVRLELGAKDMAAQETKAVIRHSSEKF